MSRSEDGGCLLEVSFAGDTASEKSRQKISVLVCAVESGVVTYTFGSWMRRCYSVNHTTWPSIFSMDG